MLKKVRRENLLQEDLLSLWPKEIMFFCFCFSKEKESILGFLPPACHCWSLTPRVPHFISCQIMISGLEPVNRRSRSPELPPTPATRECLPFQVLNKDSTTHVWSLHAPFSLVLHTLHHLEKYKQHGSVLRLRTDSLHKHFYNQSWLIHCQNSVSVREGWGGMEARSGKWKTLPSE